MSFDYDEFHALMDAYLKRHAHHVTLKSIKVFESGSEETVCFTATLYVDGKRCGKVSNDGHGGAHRYDQWGTINRLIDKIRAEDTAAGHPRMYEEVDALVDHRIEEWRLLRDVKKWARAGKVAFRWMGLPRGEYRMVKWPQVASSWPLRRDLFMADGVKEDWFDGTDPALVTIANDQLVVDTRRVAAGV